MRLARPLKAVLLVLILSVAALAESDGLALLEAGKADEALKALDARIQKNSSDAEAYNLMCRVYFQLEQWDDSIRAAEKSVALQAQNSEYHLWLGRSYGEKADTVGRLHVVSAISLVRKVKSELEKAVAMDSMGKDLMARVDLAEFYTEAPSVMGGDKSKARQLAGYVLQHDPALAHYIYGRIEEKQNSKDKAEQEYKAALEHSGNLAQYWVSLASFYRRTGRLDEMESALNKAASAQRKNNTPLFDAASTLLQAGRNYPGAIQMFRRYLAGNNFTEDAPAFQAHYLLGALLEKQGDTQGAAAEYRAALALASRYQPAQDALARVSR